MCVIVPFSTCIAKIQSVVCWLIVANKLTRNFKESNLLDLRTLGRTRSLTDYNFTTFALLFGREPQTGSPGWLGNGGHDAMHVEQRIFLPPSSHPFKTCV